MASFSIIALGAIGVAGFYLMPLIVGAAAQSLSLDPTQQGLVASAELAGMTLSSLAAISWVNRVSLRTQTSAGLALLVLGNALSAAAAGVESLVVLRLATGLGGGVVLAAAMAALAAQSNTDRVFGYLVAAEYGVAALGFVALPPVVAQHGLRGIFLALATFCVCGAPLIRFLPRAAMAKLPDDPGAAPARGSALANLAAIAAFSIGFSGVWAYAERIGSGAGLLPQVIGNALALCSVMSVLGALAVAWQGQRLRRTSLATLALAAQLVSLFALTGDLGWLRYATAFGLLSFFWNVTFPVMFSGMAELDRSGRWVVSGSVAAFAGTAAGPVMAGSLRAAGGESMLTYFGALWMLICWVALLASDRLRLDAG